jgi:predicted metal-dependent enzyme (double-stranded beta helix superfamily)
MTTIVPAALSPRQLAEQVRLVAATPRDWMSRVRLSPDERWYERMHADERYEVWLISWLPGQGTGFHDHGGSAGAFGVVWGTLEEHQAGTAGTARGPSVTASSVIAGRVRSFGPAYIHDVRNTSEAVAVSVHAYSPPLTEMTRYDLSENGLIVLDTEAADQW